MEWPCSFHPPPTQISDDPAYYKRRREPPHTPRRQRRAWPHFLSCASRDVHCCSRTHACFARASRQRHRRKISRKLLRALPKGRPSCSSRLFLHSGLYGAPSGARVTSCSRGSIAFKYKRQEVPLLLSRSYITSERMLYYFSSEVI